MLILLFSIIKQCLSLKATREKIYSVKISDVPRNRVCSKFEFDDSDGFFSFLSLIFSFDGGTRFQGRIIIAFRDKHGLGGGSLFRSTDGTESSKSRRSEFVGPQVDLT